jgi:HK97 gp10 family phage protein
MAANPSVHRFQALVAALPREIRRDIFAAVERGAELMKADMQARVPVKAGALLNSIRTEPDASRLRVTIRAGGPATTTAHGYDYALGTEFGNEDTPAQPFFWPAYRAKRRSVRAGIKRAMRAAIEKRWRA